MSTSCAAPLRVGGVLCRTMEERLSLLSKNKENTGTSDAELKNRDSSLKKITPFLKKVAHVTGTSSQRMAVVSGIALFSGAPLLANFTTPTASATRG